MEPGAWWWGPIPEDQLWAGVFQGGGARGAAYAGALRAVAARDEWFDAVAGSSAGALTAALIAAGYHPEEFGELTSYLLDSIEPDGWRSRLMQLSRWTAPLVQYNSLPLEARVERLVRDGIVRHGGEANMPLTFAALHQAVGIRLYVVSLDATTGHPVVCCAERTPDLPVAASVVASCSIPLAFASRFLETKGGLGFPQVRRIVDGGAHANLPHFVFTDEAVRDALGLDTSPRRPLLFTLSELSTPPELPTRWVAPPTTPAGFMQPNFAGDTIVHLLSKRRTDPIRSECVCVKDDEGEHFRQEEVAESRWRRVRSLLSLTVLGFLVLTPLLIASIALLVGLVIVARQVSDRIRDGSAASIVVALLLVVAIVGLGLGAAVAGRTLRAVRRVGVPTLQSVLATATGAPFWAGFASNLPVVFVPAPGLTTTGFRPSPDILHCVVGLAYEEAARQLTEWEAATMAPIASRLAQFRDLTDGIAPVQWDFLPDHHHGLIAPEPPSARHSQPGLE